MMNRYMLWTAVVAAVAMLVGALMPDHAYSYFLALRVVVCLVAAFAAFFALRSHNEVWILAFGATAALYNPFLPVHLARQVWEIVNCATILLLILGCIPLSRTPPPA